MKTMIKLAAALLCVAAAGPALAKGDTSLSLDEALKIAERARSIALAKHKDFAIVVVNREGRLVLAQRMDGVSYANLDVATAKAVTAATIGVPTKALENIPEAEKLTLMSLPSTLVLMGGGVPIMKDGKSVGGVGASGGAPSEDDEVAAGGVAAITQ